MASIDPMRTQCVAPVGIAAELTAAGFEDPEEIGHGGFGVVYRCGQSALGRTVAVKVLTADLEPGNLDRFVREQVAMGKLSGHPHIVNIFQVGSTATGRPYIVMQYHPHGSVEDRIRDDGALGWRDALHIGVKVAGALETAHCRGMLHRDVKPGNILLAEYGEPQLTDFGIARIGGAFETSDGSIIGSPAYTAPEVLQGQPPTVASDVYGLASTLFTVATGHAVFERRQGEQMVAQFLRVTRQPIPSLSDSGMPADVCTLIEQAMARGIPPIAHRVLRSSAHSCANCSIATACPPTTCRCRCRYRKHVPRHAIRPVQCAVSICRGRPRHPRRPPGSGRRWRPGPSWSGPG